MDPNTRTFPLGDVLTITTGRLVAAGGMDAVYEILNFLTGDSLHTTQLPRAKRWAAPLILDANPKLRAVSLPRLDEMLARGNSARPMDACTEWVRESATVVGDSVTLAPLPGWKHINALTELMADMEGAS